MKKLKLAILAICSTFYSQFCLAASCDPTGQITEALISAIAMEDKREFDAVLRCIEPTQMKFINAVGSRESPLSFPLCTALTIDDPYYYQSLLALGADANFINTEETDYHYKSPLFCSLDAHNDTARTRILLEHGADPTIESDHEREDRKRTALYTALDTNQFDVAQVLLEHLDQNNLLTARDFYMVSTSVDLICIKDDDPRAPYLDRLNKFLKKHGTSADRKKNC